MVGTRPNFIKMQSVIKGLLKENSFNTFFVHAGQHYDYEMSKYFLKIWTYLNQIFFLNLENKFSGSNLFYDGRV